MELWNKRYYISTLLNYLDDISYKVELYLARVKKAGLDLLSDENFSPPLKNVLAWKQTCFEWNFVFI